MENGKSTLLDILHILCIEALRALPRPPHAGHIAVRYISSYVSFVGELAMTPTGLKQLLRSCKGNKQWHTCTHEWGAALVLSHEL